MYLTAKASTAIEDRFVTNDMPWNYCVSLSVGNTNAMIGIRNSVA